MAFSGRASFCVTPPKPWAIYFMSTTAQSLEQTSINTIRTLAMDAVEAAKSGHPGTPMAAIVSAAAQKFPSTPTPP